MHAIPPSVERQDYAGDTTYTADDDECRHPGGAILLHDHYLTEQLAQFNRERVPERQPHADTQLCKPCGQPRDGFN